MVHPLKTIDVINNEAYQNEFEIVEKYEAIDGMWGIGAVKLTDKEIDALKDGKCIYYNDGEYAHVLFYGNV